VELSGPRLQPLRDFLAGLSKDRLHTGRPFLDHCLAVGNILIGWGCAEEVCLAGVCHSIYGTATSRAAALDLDRRRDLRAIVGDHAENLAYLNCAIDHRSLDLAMLPNPPSFRLRDRLTRSVIELPRATFDDLLRVHLADWIEQVPHSAVGTYRRDTQARIAAWLGGAPLAAFDALNRATDASVDRADAPFDSE